jgi:hypothetical protein
MRSAFIQWAEAQRAEARAAFEDARLAAYVLAEDECNTHLLNARGERAGIDPYSLFMGTTARAYAYASEELIDHWQRRPRPIQRDFLAQYVNLCQD